jgi:hypothetical protein
MEPSRSDNTKPSVAKDRRKMLAATGYSGRPRLDAALPPTIVSSTDIARRAYERFLHRGGEHGQDLDDWLHAERELRQARD